MPGLDPGTHLLPKAAKKLDGRVKSGHDVEGANIPYCVTDLSEMIQSLPSNRWVNSVVIGA
jgi:hypothetical protein